jgi:hypothetical protein
MPASFSQQIVDHQREIKRLQEGERECEDLIHELLQEITILKRKRSKEQLKKSKKIITSRKNADRVLSNEIKKTMRKYDMDVNNATNSERMREIEQERDRSISKHKQKHSNKQAYLFYKAYNIMHDNQKIPSPISSISK